MAWTTPRTWIPGELVTASMMNTHIRDNMNSLSAMDVDATSAPTTTGDITALPLPAGTGHLLIRMNNASLATIKGIDAGLTGQRLTIICINAGQVDLTYNDAAAAAGKKIITSVTAGKTSMVGSGAYVDLIYDGSARWMLVGHDQGAWITPAFNAAHFNGVGSMTWTVDSGDVVRSRYMLRGRELTYSFLLASTTVGGTLGNTLFIASGQWGGYTHQSGSDWTRAAYALDNLVLVEAYLAGNATNISIIKISTANWTASTNQTNFSGIYKGEVQ